jgi:hypothetical protein
MTDQQADQIISILKSIEQHLVGIESSTSRMPQIWRDTSKAVEYLKDIRDLSE